MIVRRLAHDVRRLPLSALPRDVDAITGLCAGGFVRIAPSAKKGLGAFAAKLIPSSQVVGTYAGEQITFGDMLERYGAGGGADGPQEYDKANRQAEWAQSRARRGVGVSGQYIFAAGICPATGRDVLLDGEDPKHANWTRFINHSAQNPNLMVSRAVDSSPVVQFVTQRSIATGEELLFDYADGFDLHDVLGFEEC